MKPIIGFNSNPLQNLIEMLTHQSETLGKARDAFLKVEAQRKHFEARLVQESPGKSHSEKLSNAQAKEEWLKFHVALARLESIYEFQKLKFSVLEKEWMSVHLEYKLNAGVINKNG